MPNKQTLPAAHLVRHYLLFVFTVIFLLTLIRSAYALWQFVDLEETGAFVDLFLQGLRFDLALVGFICLVPVVLGSILSMFKVTLGLSKFVITLFLFVGLFIILLLELITPWFINTQGIRPDVATLQAIESPLSVLKTNVVEYAIPAAILSVLCLLILVAFWSRMEMKRFLRFPVSVPAALTTAFVGGVLCILAIWSTPDVRQPVFGPEGAQISGNDTINDLTLNSTSKAVYSLLMPYISSPES